MGRIISRLVLMVWFTGIVAVVVWNGQGSAAKGNVNASVYLPLLHKNHDYDLRNYVGLIRTNHGFYTVRGDGSGFRRLGQITTNIGTWSPNGKYLAFVSVDGLGIMEIESTSTTILNQAWAAPPVWSPTNNYVAYFTSNSLILYSPDTLALHVFPQHSALNPGSWSPSGDRLVWTEHNGEHRELWVWTEQTMVPQRIAAVDSEYIFEPYWSPDGNELIYNSRLSDEVNYVFRTIVNDFSQIPPPVLVLEGAIMQGWVEGGARLVFQREASLYLAKPDVSMPTLIYQGTANSTHRMYVVISPTGDKILFYGHDSRQYVRTTTESENILVDGCYFNQWDKEGIFLSCSRNQGDYGGFLGSTLADSRANPIQASYELFALLHPNFIENSPYVGTTHHNLRTTTLGYPVLDEPDGSYLFDLRSGGAKQVHHENDTQFQVSEWRYMP